MIKRLEVVIVSEFPLTNSGFFFGTHSI